MPESQLPSVYVKKEPHKRSRTEAGFFADGRRATKMRKEDSYYAPRSLFDRPSPALMKMRRDLKMNRHRGILRSIPMSSNVKQQLPVKPLIEPEGMVEWFIYEDMAILNVIQNLQGLPLNLMLLCPGHTPNWDLVADIVNQTSRTYRSPKQCRYRYEAVIVPREEGKLLESPKKQKKNKNPLKHPMKNSRAMRTSQLFTSDNNNSFTKLAKMKFDYIKAAMAKKQPPAKSMLINSNLKNPKHMSVLQDFGISNYDNPPSPYEIAIKRFERLTKEKQKTQANQQSVDGQSPSANPQLIAQPMAQQQQILKQQIQQIIGQPLNLGTAQVVTHQPQTIIQQQANTIAQSGTTPQILTQQTIVVQSPNSNLVGQQGQQTITALVPSNMQGQARVQGQTAQIIGQTGQQQIMKVVASTNQQGKDFFFASNLYGF
jgi:E1A-binding protein p400